MPSLTPISFHVRVRDQGGAYVTNTVNGKRASSTMSAEQAATVLAIKLVTDRPASVRSVPDKQLPPNVTLWEITA